MPDWVQSLLTPATIVAAVAFLSFRLERMMMILVCKINAIEHTIMYGPDAANGTAKFYEETLKRFLAEKRFQSGK